MNSEPKSFASLSSGLLARKGAARPAMRPQGFGQVGTNGIDDLGWNDMGFEAPKPSIAPIRDEDHDAFGDEVPAPAIRNPLAALTPVGSPVHEQQAELAGRFGASDDDAEESNDGDDYVDDTAELYEPQPEVASISLAPAVTVVTEPAPRRIAPPSARRSRPRAASGSKAKAAFTLRLDNDRHLKLRLACAVDGRSAQQIVTEALDALLKGMPELDQMAEKAPKKTAA